MHWRRLMLVIPVPWSDHQHLKPHPSASSAITPNFTQWQSSLVCWTSDSADPRPYRSGVDRLGPASRWAPPLAASGHAPAPSYRMWSKQLLCRVQIAFECLVVSLSAGCWALASLRPSDDATATDRSLRGVNSHVSFLVCLLCSCIVSTSKFYKPTSCKMKGQKGVNSR